MSEEAILDDITDVVDIEENQQPPADDYEIDLKEVRKKQWKEAIEADLQQLIITAAKLRKNISEAKTSTKKNFYNKKFNKVSAQVRQYVSALQRLGSPVLPEGTDNGNDTTDTDLK